MKTADERIEEVRRAAEQAGDMKTVELCGRALEGDQEARAWVLDDYRYTAGE